MIVTLELGDIPPVRFGNDTVTDGGAEALQVIQRRIQALLYDYALERETGISSEAAHYLDREHR